MFTDDADEDDPSPVGELLEALTAFLDEANEADERGWAMVERMRVTMPIEFYVRSDPGGSGRVTALQGRPSSRTLTSVMPVLHGFTVVVEVDRAEQREPGLEP
jgi:hypothetical protein